MSRNEHHILVLGAGYTGMLTAIRAAKRTRRTGGQVTLVNPSPRFTEQLRLHQLATGQEMKNFQIPEMLDGTGVEFVQGWASEIDPGSQQVTVLTEEGSRVLGYHTLVYAIGSFTDTSMVPGADQHAYTLSGADNAGRLKPKLAEIASSDGNVVVVGGGLTGVEAAAEIAESYPGVGVTLLSRQEPGSMMSEKARAYLLGALTRLGVEIRSGVEITKVLPDAVELAGGELVHSDATLWTTGRSVAPLATEAGIATDGTGQVKVDASLRSVSHPSIYAIGDAAAVSQSYGVMHGTCQGGIPTALHAADSIGRQLRGKEPKPFRFGYFHQPVSIGRKDGVIQFTHPDDTPSRWFITGRKAVFYKEQVTSSPWKTYGISRRMNLPARSLSRTGGRKNPVAA